MYKRCFCLTILDFEPEMSPAEYFTRSQPAALVDYRIYKSRASNLIDK